MAFVVRGFQRTRVLKGALQVSGEFTNLVKKPLVLNSVTNRDHGKIGVFTHCSP